MSATNVFRIECNIDDMNPELYPGLLDSLFAAEAVDAWLTPIIMKRGRPAVCVNALCEENNLSSVVDCLLHKSSTFGVRWYPLERKTLERSIRKVKTPYGEVRIKEGFLNGKLLKQSPEFVDCQQLANASGVSEIEVFRSSLIAALPNEDKDKNS